MLSLRTWEKNIKSQATHSLFNESDGHPTYGILILVPPFVLILYGLVHLSEALSSKQSMGDVGIMVSCSISMLVAMPLATICLWYCKTVKLHLLKSFPIKIQQYPVQGWFSNLTFVKVCNNMYFMVSRIEIKKSLNMFPI